MWREEKISEMLMEKARLHPELMFIADQNLVNLYLYGRIGELSPRWNKQFVYRKIREGEWKMPYCVHAWDPPHIIHFVSEEKPWLPNCALPEKELFFRYWQKTKFPFQRPDQASESE
jgi:lipopolysaccharide biosynthesis glycosyltransferase